MNKLREVPIFPPAKMGKPIEITPETRAAIDEFLEDFRARVYRNERKGACPACGRGGEDV